MKTFAYLAVAAVALSAVWPASPKGERRKGGRPQRQRARAGVGGRFLHGFPFATRVAENVAKTTGGAAAKVESPGHRRRLQAVLQRHGRRPPGHRQRLAPMKKSEFEQCAANGVTDIVEIKIGFDGIVIANAKGRLRPSTSSSTRSIRGLAAEVPAGRPASPNNAAKTWRDVDAGLPAPGDPGLRPAAHLRHPRRLRRTGAWKSGAARFPALEALHEKTDEDAFKAKAHTIRSRRRLGRRRRERQRHRPDPDQDPQRPGRVRLLVPREQHGHGEGRHRSTASPPPSRPSRTAPTRCPARSTST